MPLPEDEASIWGKVGNTYPRSGTKTDDMLARKFPELVRAGGSVDPQEAIIALLDKIAELEARVDEA